jgi:putative Mg2+ transporter-C (MgtC) family protein
MRESIEQLLNADNMFLSHTLVRLLLAAFLGGAIGLEREVHHKPAGLRTNLFICVGSAMFTLLSDRLAMAYGGDHTRIAAQIIPGIGFIGAGSILHSRGSVTGLTTAATLFMVASIGMAVGGGLYVVAIFATLIVALALNLLGWFETRFNLKPLVLAYEVVGAQADAVLSDVNQILHDERRMMQTVHIGRTNGDFRVHFTVDATRREHKDLFERIRHVPSAKSAELLTGDGGE